MVFLKLPFCLVASVVLWCCVAIGLAWGARAPPLYNNEFAVHIPDGHGAADGIASKHGFVNRGQVSVKYIFKSVKNTFVENLIHAYFTLLKNILIIPKKHLGKIFKKQKT